MLILLQHDHVQVEDQATTQFTFILTLQILACLHTAAALFLLLSNQTILFFKENQTI